MKNIFYKFGAWISVVSASVIPVTAFAQLKGSKATGSDLKSVGDTLSKGGSAQKELPEMIGGLINVFLSVLGIVFVVLVVYAGYLWMTDVGGGKKIETAKKLLGAAIVGLVLIVAAYAISTFVIDRLLLATT